MKNFLCRLLGHVDPKGWDGLGDEAICDRCKESFWPGY